MRHTEEDLLKVKNLGEKALAEIGEMLGREGLGFGMPVQERGGGEPARAGEAVAVHPGEAEAPVE